MKRTPEEHKQKHRELHQSLDELFADYIRHHPNETSFTTMPFKQLLDWSHEQTIKPTWEEK